MNCPICDKVIEQVDGKRAKKYCSQTCKQAFYRKSKDSAILAQKQGLENAPESATIDDNVTIDNVTPHIVTSNRNKDAAGNDNPTLAFKSFLLDVSSYRRITYSYGKESFISRDVS